METLTMQSGTKQQMNVQQIVDQASSVLNCLWPLNTFIACNAVKGLESLPFERAMTEANRLLDGRGFLPLAKYRSLYESGRIAHVDLQEAFQNEKSEPVTSKLPIEKTAESPTWGSLLDMHEEGAIVSGINRQVIKWLGAFFDNYQAQWGLEKQSSLYAHWLDLAKFDRTLDIYKCKGWKTSLADLPRDAEAAVLYHLTKIGVSDEDSVEYLRSHLTQLPGWASHLKWRDSQDSTKHLLTEYLAIRLFYEHQLSAAFTQGSSERNFVSLKTKHRDDSKKQPLENYAAVWQDAYEINYRNRLLSALQTNIRNSEERDSIPAAQLVFCIDVRSEPLRRHLENVGSYATYGFAGFFGFAVQFTEEGSKKALELCPVLLKPKKEVKQRIKENAQRIISGRALNVAAMQLRKHVKSSVFGAFGFVEAFGLYSTVPLLYRTFFPEQFNSREQKLVPGAKKTDLDISNFSLEEKLDMAEGNLRAIGITHDFAPLVVLCGHKSLSANNPFASSLDCGACGGNSGGFSAQLAAKIFNEREVRDGLRKRQIDIPDSTLFVAAEHNTTTDEIVMFGLDNIPANWNEPIKTLTNDLETAAQRVRRERSERLPASVLTSLNTPKQRASDWAQVLPEWGLARNAAFIAAPRKTTAGLNLEGRTFLHSYDHDSDPEASILTTIMTAPLVVAQWINCQYYLSSMDNEVFGSGSKTVHNVVGDFGVMQGACSDLKLGLPRQSVCSTEESLEHEPMRLLAVIEAPLKRIDSVLANNPSIGGLVLNRWIKLIAIEPESGRFYQWQGTADWKALTLPAAEAIPQDELYLPV